MSRREKLIALVVAVAVKKSKGGRKVMKRTSVVGCYGLGQEVEGGRKVMKRKSVWYSQYVRQKMKKYLAMSNRDIEEFGDITVARSCGTG